MKKRKKPARQAPAAPKLAEPDGDREAYFHPAARLFIRGLSKKVRKALGKDIRELQKGNKLKFPKSRPMDDVSPGAAELRVKDDKGAYRVFYVVPQYVVIFHGFTKKTETTPDHEKELGKKRLKEMGES